MVKFITKSVCMALIAMLCVGNLNAQSARKAPEGMSKSTTSALSLVSASAQHHAPAKGRDVVFSEGFEGTTLPNLPAGWTSTGAWKTMDNFANDPALGDDFPPHTGTRMMGCLWNTLGLHWAFSPGFTLQAGEAYDISFWYSAMGYQPYGEADDFEVKIGTAANAGGMTDLIFTQGNIVIGFDFTWHEATKTFTPSSSGTYYLGFHDLRPTAGGEYGLCITIDDIEITGGGTGGDDCPAVTDVTAEAQGTKVKVTWTEPAKALTGYKIYQDGTEKATVAAGVTEWISDALNNGTYTFAVAATFDDGCTPVKVAAAPVEIKTCNGVVSNLDVAYEPDCSMATLTWDAPANPGFEEITYSYHDGSWENGHVYYFGYDGWMGVYFHNATSGEIHTIRVLGIDNNSSTLVPVTIDIFNDDRVLIGTSDPFQFQYNSGTGVWNEVEFATPVEYSGPFYAMVHMNNPGASPAHSAYIACDENGPNINAGLSWFIQPDDGVWVHPSSNPCVMFIEADVLSSGKSMTVGYHPQTSDTPIVLKGIAEMEAPNGGSIEAPEVIKTPRADAEVNIYRDGLLIGGPTTETTFEDTEFDPNSAHTWSVAVACSNGGDGEWVNVEKDACVPPGPEPCDPITGGTAAVVCDEAVITWEAVTGAVGYKVSKEDGTPLEIVTDPVYTETGEFEDGVTYKWVIVTVCEDDESDPVEISGVADCVGINELSNSVSIYPNPVSGMVTIKVENFAKVEIYNTVGQLVETKTIQTFNVSSYNTGIYFFKVYDVYNNSVTKRVMVK